MERNWSFSEQCRPAPPFPIVKAMPSPWSSASVSGPSTCTSPTCGRPRPCPLGSRWGPPSRSRSLSRSRSSSTPRTSASSGCSAANGTRSGPRRWRCRSSGCSPQRTLRGIASCVGSPECGLPLRPPETKHTGHASGTRCFQARVYSRVMHASSVGAIKAGVPTLADVNQAEAICKHSNSLMWDWNRWLNLKATRVSPIMCKEIMHSLNPAIDKSTRSLCRSRRTRNSIYHRKDSLRTYANPVRISVEVGSPWASIPSY